MLARLGEARRGVFRVWEPPADQSRGVAYNAISVLVYVVEEKQRRDTLRLEELREFMDHGLARSSRSGKFWDNYRVLESLAGWMRDEQRDAVATADLSRVVRDLFPDASDVTGE